MQLIEERQGHSINLNPQTGAFIVQYKREDAIDNEDDTVEKGATTKSFDTLAKAREFCDRRFETKEKMKKTPLGLKVTNESGDNEIKGVHAGNGNLLVVDKRVRVQTSNYACSYPVHEKITPRIAELRRLNAEVKALEDRITLIRASMKGARIVYNSYDPGNDEARFKEAYADAVKGADKLPPFRAVP